MTARRAWLLIAVLLLAAGVAAGLAQATGVFSPPSFYSDAASSEPFQAAIGRLNHDKKPDMVVANCVSGSVDKITLRFGTGQGLFGPRKHLKGRSCADGVVIADLNADHKQDVAVTSHDDGVASVFLGRGDGTFRARADYPTGAGSFGILAEDFNRDGKLDLATTNNDANSISVLLGRGNGTFKKRKNTQLGPSTAPWGLVSVKMNSDKKPDLAVTENGANAIATLVGNGDGRFATPDTYPTDPGPSGIAMGRLGPDSRPYLVSANDGASTLSVFRVSHGECVAIITLTVGTHPQGVAAVDLTGDGKLDLVSANLASDDVSLVTGNGDETFGAHDDYPAGAGPAYVTPAKLDGDRRPDLVVANNENTAPGVSVLLAKP
jgi:hypothetical protein